MKKLVSVYLVVMVVLTTIFYSVVSVGAVNSFNPRLTAPTKSNKYYYDPDYNVFEKYGYGLPNCTAYVYGREYELLKKRPNLCPYNAGEWWSYNKAKKYYSYGSTPKLGAIACWDKFDNNSGHVAVVEKITKDTVTISQSAYGGVEFFTETVDRYDDNLGFSSKYRFLGYIYLLEDDLEVSTPPTTTPNKKIDTQVWKIDEKAGVNLRSGAGTSYKAILTIPDNEIVHVTEVKKANGYTWGKVTYNKKTGWCALDFANKVGLLYDVKRDNKININDLTEIKLYLSSYKILDATQRILGDTDLNKRVTVIDLLTLQLKLANKI